MWTVLVFFFKNKITVITVLSEIPSSSFIATTFLQMLQSSLYIEPTFPFLSDLFYLLTLGVEVMVALDHTQCHKHTPLDEGSALCRDIYLTTHEIHSKHTSMPLAEFEPVIPASKQPQIHALDRSATG
jgi:hypothetical protein